ncbi:MAG TPA: HDOD domain-containing protein [Syntrophorhabdales bacterium]|nr:HDOD domain-containing protein [Syntrophorhabdales bacterium]
MLDVEAVRAKVERTNAIPTIPLVIKKILMAVENPSTSPAAVSKLVSSDPALTARVLKVINAAMYGFVARISSVNQAVVLLGMNLVRALLLGISMFEMMEQAAMGLWKHSLGCAIIAKMLAQKKGMFDPEEASVAGLLHDIGKVVLSVQYPKEYQAAVAAAQEKSVFLTETEAEIFGMSHATAGAYFANTWRLPKFLVESIRSHHLPPLTKSFPVHAATVHMADVLVKAYNVGYSGDPFVPAVHATAWELFNLNEAQMKDLFSEISDLLAQVDDFFKASKR